MSEVKTKEKTAKFNNSIRIKQQNHLKLLKYLLIIGSLFVLSNGAERENDIPPGIQTRLSKNIKGLKIE